MKILILVLVLGIAVLGYFYFDTTICELNRLSATEGWMPTYEERIHRFSTVSVNAIKASEGIKRIPDKVTAALKAKDFELARKYIKEIQNEIHLHKKNGTWTGDNRTNSYARQLPYELEAYIEVSLEWEKEIKDKSPIFRALYFYVRKKNKETNTS